MRVRLFVSTKGTQFQFLLFFLFFFLSWCQLSLESENEVRHIIFVAVVALVFVDFNHIDFVCRPPLCIRQRLPVRFILDRSGLVGNDGPTHHGVFDLAYMGCLPDIVIMAPSDEVIEWNGVGCCE